MKYLLTSIVVIQLLSCHLDRTSNTFDTLKTGVFAAKEKNVKIFVVFDAFGSPTNYVDKILQDEEIATALNHNVIVRLRCDDKSNLNDTLSVGEFNSNLQREITGEYYQPMFCFLDKTGAKISPPLGYSKKESVIEYIEKHIK